jgi:hypothetical protein
MDQDSELYKMKCWPFGIVEGCPKDKDERVDDWSWEVVPGMAIRYLSLCHFIALESRPSRHVLSVHRWSLIFVGSQMVICYPSTTRGFWDLESKCLVGSQMVIVFWILRADYYTGSCYGRKLPGGVRLTSSRAA